uniref:Uncharacterized protein n=1 Tax=Quercus lobata TaxID=97700 RepID=A0A7N2LDU3_QUELO
MKRQREEQKIEKKQHQGGTGFNDDSDEVTYGWLELLIRGDRGSGMDILQSSDPRMKTLQENSIISFNAAFKVSRESLFWSSKSLVVEMSKSSL